MAIGSGLKEELKITGSDTEESNNIALPTRQLAPPTKPVPLDVVGSRQSLATMNCETPTRRMSGACSSIAAIRRKQGRFSEGETPGDVKYSQRSARRTNEKRY